MPVKYLLGGAPRTMKQILRELHSPQDNEIVVLIVAPLQLPRVLFRADPGSAAYAVTMALDSAAPENQVWLTTPSAPFRYLVQRVADGEEPVPAFNTEHIRNLIKQ